MSWIVMRTDLAGDPSTISISNSLDVGVYETIGILHCLWSWIDAQSHNGHALGVTKVNIDRLVGVTGFASAIEKAGWLVVEKDGITIPNFDNWMSKSAKKRLKAAKRKQKQRSSLSHIECDKSVTTVQNITEQVKNNPPTPLRGHSSWEEIETKLNGSPLKESPEFKFAWRCWVVYRKERRKPLTASTVTRQIKKLAAMGADQAVASIERSIEQGWTGLFDETKPSAVKPPGRVQSRPGKYAGM